MPLLQLLVEVLHREVRVFAPEHPQHPLQLFVRRPPRRSPAHAPVDQPVIALRLVAFRPALKRPHVNPQKLRRSLLRQLLRLRPIQQIRKPHPSYTLVNGCRAHRAPFVLGHQNTTLHELQTGDRSRATDTQIRPILQFSANQSILSKSQRHPILRRKVASGPHGEECDFERLEPRGPRNSSFETAALRPPQDEGRGGCDSKPQSTFAGAGCSVDALATRAAFAMPAWAAIFFCGSEPGCTTPADMIRVAASSALMSISMILLLGT